jgi:prepilin peptidase CpaA
MATSAPAASASVVNDLGLDREFLLKMASWPVIAAGFTAAAWLGHSVHSHTPVVLLCVAMIVAAVIDGWAFKVPNWLTMPLILSGWGIGLLHDFGVPVGPGPIDPIYRDSAGALGGGFSAALLGTAIGFAMLFPALFIGGMGQGDVKMQMGFGSWVGALYGGYEGAMTTALAICAGMIAGGVIAVVMMLLRGDLSRNARNFGEILNDFKVLAVAGPKYASERARNRRASWHRLPYGIPLCIGFVGYLVYLYATAG